MLRSKTLWSSRFNKKPAKLLEEFNNSLCFDKRLYKEDIDSSIAYAGALASAKIISRKEERKITSALKKIKTQITKQKEKWFKENNCEDIHTAIENKLVAIVGDAGKKLHTARSRNEQVACDLRLWLKKEVKEILTLLKQLQGTLISIARKHYKTIMPGYTHLQKAQAVTLGHNLLAHFQQIARDKERLKDLEKRINVLPLGSGALSGTSFKINRKLIAKKLGFSKISENSLDAVSDRDFVCEALFNIALLNVHLSQLSEELILWSTDEFGFLEISDAYATGSSLMPQKKNPDVPELIRGKTGRLVGNLVAILNVLKGLPLAYNKDLQEDKELVFDSVDNIKAILGITNLFLQNIIFNKDKMHEAATNSFLSATDVADYLVKKSVPFRDAHNITGKIVMYCAKKRKRFNDLTLHEWKKFHNLFNGDIIKKIKLESSVNSKNTYGGTAPKEILKAIQKAKVTI